MGTYTGIRAKIILHEKYVPQIRALMEYKYPEGVWKTGDYVESRWCLTDFKEWATVGRCDFIPFGALAYMPWEDNDPEWQRKLDGNEWTFQCSLKNYNDEIEQFMATVLPVIAKEIKYFEVLYEMSGYGRLYTMVDGAVVECGEKNYKAE